MILKTFANLQFFERMALLRGFIWNYAPQKPLHVKVHEKALKYP